MKIGQRVIVNLGDDNQIEGIYAGTGVMQKFVTGPMETMAIIRLTVADSGYIQPAGMGKKPVSFVNSLVVDPSKLTIIKD